MHLFDAANEEFSARSTASDICGLAPAPAGLAYTTGLGLVGATHGGYPPYRHAGIAFDNHLVANGWQRSDVTANHTKPPEGQHLSKDHLNRARHVTVSQHPTRQPLRGRVQGGLPLTEHQPAVND